MPAKITFSVYTAQHGISYSTSTLEVSSIDSKLWQQVFIKDIIAFPEAHCRWLKRYSIFPLCH